MKKTVLLFIFILAMLISNAQNKEKELSNAEKFSAKAGKLIQKEFIDIGSIKGVKLQVVYLTDIITLEKLNFIRFECAIENVGKKIGTLDFDEIDGFIKSIKIIQDKILPSTPTNYIEVKYKSRGGFEAGCFWSKNFFSKKNWIIYIQPDKYDDRSQLFLNQEDFATILSLLEQAKAKL